MLKETTGTFDVV